MHITGFKSALTRTLNAQIKNGNAKDSETFTGDDVLEGLTAVVSIKMREVQFEGQTKSNLGSVEARGAVEAVFSEALGRFLEEHPEDARAIVGKVALAMKSRKAAKAAKDSILRKGALEGMLLAFEQAAEIADEHWPEQGHVHPEEAISCQMSISVLIRRRETALRKAAQEAQ